MQLSVGMWKRKIAAIIQARMGSTRLPDKTMKEIVGKPLLWHVIQGVKKSKRIGIIVIAPGTYLRKADSCMVGGLGESSACERRLFFPQLQ